MQPQWTLEKDFTFEAAHQLPKHDGKCARLHGHSWKGRISIVSDSLHEDGPKSGMVLDYGDLSSIVKPMVDEFLDHHHLNETLDLENPTSEEIARWVYKYLTETSVPNLSTWNLRVTIEETCTARCTYTERMES